MAIYLVTGGCGFIGSHLADALVGAGHAVRILDDLSTGCLAHAPPAATLIRGDVAEPCLLAEAMDGADGCFHLAAIASVQRGNLDWLAMHRANLGGTVAVLDAARRANRRGPVPVVYASSAAVYGDGAEGRTAEGTAPPRPLSAYGVSKLGGELYARVAGAVHDVPTLGLRLFNVYGPRQNSNSPYSGVVSIFCDRLRAGRAITIFGDGLQTRDFIHVGDVVRALLAAMRHASLRGEVLDICTGRATTIRDLAATIGALLGVVPEVEFRPPRADDIWASLGDPSEAWRRLRFVAETGLRDGLARMLAMA